MRSTSSNVEFADVVQGWDRWAPLAGIAFVICFIGSVVASNVPADNASDAKWLAAYAGSSHQRGHVITGFLLI